MAIGEGLAGLGILYGADVKVIKVQDDIAQPTEQWLDVQDGFAGESLGLWVDGQVQTNASQNKARVWCEVGLDAGLSKPRCIE